MVEVALVKSEAIPPMSLKEVKGQIHLIQEIMSDVMKENEHYGTIPGTTKPTLLKPGAEKLCLTFRFDPEYEIVRVTENSDYVSYTILCTLLKIGGGYKIASGMGACNSAEIKYRYRWEDTGREVPKQYWENRNARLLGVDGIYRPKKVEKEWIIFKRVENDNPRDLANTLLKMACKRALVAAVLNGTAASDIFTQDLEDMHTGKVEAEATIEDGDKQEKKEETDKKEGTPEKPTFLDRLATAKAMLGAEKYEEIVKPWGDTEKIPPELQEEILTALRVAVRGMKKQVEAKEENPTKAKRERKDTVQFLLINLEAPFSPSKVADLLRLQGDHIDWLDPDGDIYLHRGDVLTDLYERGIATIFEGERGKRGVKYAITAP